MKKDITFIVIGVFITVVIPVVSVLCFKKQSASDIAAVIGCVTALDGLCFIAHKSANKTS